MTLSKFKKMFSSCQQIYGVQEVHVQLIAKQLNVPVSDVVDFVLGSNGLVQYRMNQVNSGYSNQIMGNLYPGMLIVGVSSLVELNSSSVLYQNVNDPTLVIHLPKDLELDETPGTIDSDDLDIDLGLTGLSITSVSYAYTNNIENKVTIVLDGSPLSGSVKVRVPGTLIKKENETDPDFPDTDWIEFNVVSVGFDSFLFSQIWNAIDALDSRVDALENK